jgi:hypothetical protein
LYKTGYPLKTDVDFDNAISYGLNVSITKDGILVGIGYIEAHSYHVVKLVDHAFFKEDCIFSVWK